MSRPLRPWLVVPHASVGASPEALLGLVKVPAVLVMAGTRKDAARLAFASDERPVVVFSLSQAWRIGSIHGDDGVEHSAMGLMPGYGGPA